MGLIREGTSRSNTDLRWSDAGVHQSIILQRDFEIQGVAIDVIPAVGDT